MCISARFFGLAAGAYVLSGLGQCQEAKQLTPRQLFHLQPEKRPKPSRKSVPPTEPDRQKGSESPTVVSVSVPLVLRYSLLKKGRDGHYQEVDPDEVFHSGDGIRINIQANDNGYLYIAQHGSSGAWEVLFPSAEIAGGDNRVERSRSFEVPPKGQFKFEEPSGTERLFIVLSRNPEQELEKLIYGQAGGGKEKDTTEKILIAQNSPNIDAVVNGIRTRLQARDLVFEKEKVDQRTNDKAAKSEKAMYVVNASRRPDEPVIIDLQLKHQ